MLHRVERTALHYDVGIAATPTHAPSQSLVSILKTLGAVSTRGEAVWHRNRGNAVIRVADVRFNNAGTRAVVLFQHTDIDAADPSFSILATGATRTEQKAKGEGVAVSAHFVIDLVPSADGVYRAIIEHVPGLTKSYVEQALQAIIRSSGRYVFKDMNGVVSEAYPRLTLTARLRECLFADIARGRLSNVLLIKRKNVGDLFDADATTRIREGTVKLEPIEGRSGQTAIEWIHRIIKRGREHGFTNARFVYTDEDGKSKSPTFGIQLSDSFDAFVAKASIFKVEDDLAQCEPHIRADVSVKMDQLLKKHVAELAA